MKKIYLLFVAAALAACSAEPVETEGIDSLDASMTASKIKALEADYLDFPETACAGQEAQFTYYFAGKVNGKTGLKIDLWGDDPSTSEEVAVWYPIDQKNLDGGGPVNFNYIFSTAGSYSLRYQISGGQPNSFSVLVENCGCEESFTYIDNGDMTYTFTYVPEEDMMGAEIVFTFAQSVDVSGFSSGWEWHGQTMQTEMDLKACTSYSWDLTLIKKCGGNTPNNNVWTDFKVNDLSKKNENTPTISKSCSE